MVAHSPLTLATVAMFMVSSAASKSISVMLLRHPRRPTPTTSVRAQCMRHRLHKTKHGYEFGNALALAFVPGASHVKELGSGESKWRRTPSPPRIRYFSDRNMPLTITIKGKTTHNRNRYDRFRNCLLSISNSADSQQPSVEQIPYRGSQSFNETGLIQVGKHAVEMLSSNRRSFNRTWKRLCPLLELIVLARQGGDAGGAGSGCEKTNTVEAGGSRPSRRISTIADIGCDHGILSVSLACMAWAASRRRGHDKEERPRGSDGSAGFYSWVVGADVSATALENGGLVSLEKMKEAMLPMLREGDGDPTMCPASALPIDFRVGDGLAPVRHGEADVVVLAGMGVHNMLEILFGKDDAPPGSAPVDVVGTQQIFVQPTNSRPQHMVILYDALQTSGWLLRDETIAYLGRRWYVNSFFVRGHGDVRRFPGHCLWHDDAYDAYVRHHLRWLQNDHERPRGVLAVEDRRWLEHVRTSEEHARWKQLASWYVE